MMNDAQQEQEQGMLSHKDTCELLLTSSTQTLNQHDIQLLQEIIINAELHTHPKFCTTYALLLNVV